MKPVILRRWLRLPEHFRSMASLAVVTTTALMLLGCASGAAVTSGKRAIPVECKEPVPERPVMPTAGLPLPTSADEVKVDPWVQAAAAEIDLREGYEVKLRAGLVACTTPIQADPNREASR